MKLLSCLCWTALVRTHRTGVTFVRKRSSRQSKAVPKRTELNTIIEGSNKDDERLSSRDESPEGVEQLVRYLNWVSPKTVRSLSHSLALVLGINLLTHACCQESHTIPALR